MLLFLYYDDTAIDITLLHSKVVLFTQNSKLYNPNTVHTVNTKYICLGWQQPIYGLNTPK
jgi:hypothetical protein